MQHIQTIAAPVPPDVTLTGLIERHGSVATLVALARVLIARTRRPRADALSTHLRQDIGLPPKPATRRHWEIR